MAPNVPIDAEVLLRHGKWLAALARMTGAPEDTVRTRVRRGIALLRERLEASVVDHDEHEEHGRHGGTTARALLFTRLAQIARDGGTGTAAGAGAAAGVAAG